MKYLISFALLALLGVKAFDNDLALTSAYYSKVSGCKELDISQWNCAPCQHERINGAVNSKVFIRDENGGLAYVTYHPKQNRIIVAFRGSKNILNWI
jgi:hypothetical protein